MTMTAVGHRADFWADFWASFSTAITQPATLDLTDRFFGRSRLGITIRKGPKNSEFFSSKSGNDDDDEGGVGQVHHEGASGLQEVRRANDFRGGPVPEGKK